MALILNLETATEICSVGLSENGQLLALREAAEGYNHASQITLLIEQCFEEVGKPMNALDAVAVSKGPGSYTALRVGASVAKGICYALDKPFLAIDTLHALALAAWEREARTALYIPMIDARRMEVYTAIYDPTTASVSPTEARIIDAQSYQSDFEAGKSLVFCGNGAPKCQTVIESPLAHFSPIVCSAAHLVNLAEKAYLEQAFADLAYFSPSYFKAPNITKPKKIL